MPDHPSLIGHETAGIRSALRAQNSLTPERTSSQDLPAEADLQAIRNAGRSPWRG